MEGGCYFAGLNCNRDECIKADVNDLYKDRC